MESKNSKIYKYKVIHLHIHTEFYLSIQVS